MAKVEKGSLISGEKSHVTGRGHHNIIPNSFVRFWFIIGLIRTIKRTITEGCNSVKTRLWRPLIIYNRITTPTEDHKIISEELTLLNQSWREESTKYTPTLPDNDFPNSASRGLRNNGFCPNPPEIQGRKADSPDEILSEKRIKSYSHLKINGLSMEQITRYAKEELGNRFIRWLNMDDIKNGPEILERLQSGCYLIAISGMFMNHCTALYVTEDHYIEFYDSMGKSFYDYLGIPVSDLILSNLKPVISNDKQFQDQRYNTCGLHTVYSLRERDNLGSMERVQGSYPTKEPESLDKNDHYVIHAIYMKQKCHSNTALASTAVKSSID